MAINQFGFFSFLPITNINKPCLTSAISWQDFRKVEETDDGWRVLNKLNPAANAVQVVGQYEGKFDGVGQGYIPLLDLGTTHTVEYTGSATGQYTPILGNSAHSSQCPLFVRNDGGMFYITSTGEILTFMATWDSGIHTYKCVRVENEVSMFKDEVQVGTTQTLADNDNCVVNRVMGSYITRGAGTAQKISISNQNGAVLDCDFSTGKESVIYNKSNYTKLEFTAGDYFNNISSYISAGSSVKLITESEYLQVEIATTMFDSYPTFAHIVVLVNGVYYTHLNALNNGDSVVDLDLPFGVKTIELVNGATSKPSVLWRTYVKRIVSYEIVKLIAPFKQSEFVIFLGDSITVGGNAELASYNGYVGRIKRNNPNVSFAIEGYGYGTLFGYKDDINTLVAGFTGANKIYIALGTNDYALNKWDDIADFQASYAELLDQIHNELSNCEVYCQTPIIRQTETANAKGQTTQDFRNAIISECNSRSWCSLVNGENILSLADLADGVHPTATGHLKYADAINDLFASNEPIIPDGHGVLRNDIELNIYLGGMDLNTFWQQGTGKCTLALEGGNYSSSTGYIPARNDGSGLDALGNPIQINPYDWINLPLYSFRYPSSLPIMDKANTVNWSDNTGGLDWSYAQLKSIPEIKKAPVQDMVFMKDVRLDKKMQEVLITGTPQAGACLDKTKKWTGLGK